MVNALRSHGKPKTKLFSKTHKKQKQIFLKINIYFLVQDWIDACLPNFLTKTISLILSIRLRLFSKITVYIYFRKKKVFFIFENHRYIIFRQKSFFFINLFSKIIQQFSILLFDHPTFTAHPTHFHPSFSRHRIIVCFFIISMFVLKPAL